MPEKLNRVIYTIWSGDNAITPKRLQCLETIKKNTGVPMILVTPANLHEYIVDGHPLPDGYQYLSYTHKADYLRCYLMHHHGGGYTDIKFWRYDWNIWFDSLENSDMWVNGFPCIKAGWTANPELKSHYRHLIGNCAYIYKPYTALTQDWLSNMDAMLDIHYEDLKVCPQPPIPQACIENGDDYPVRWAYVGRCMDPAVYKHRDKALREMKFDDAPHSVYR